MEEELQKIRDARQSVYAPRGKFGIYLVLCFIGGALHPFFAAIFGVLSIAELLKRFKQVAKLPCPNCGEPFGSESNFPIGVGGAVCQNCEQHLYL